MNARAKEADDDDEAHSDEREDDGEEEDAVTEDAVLDLDMDHHGRVAGVSGLDYTSRSFYDFLGEELAAQLRLDCERLQGYSEELDATFWLPASAGG